jgi:poly(glycerol-phosphate) alpha-glucosyltransferase
MILRTANIVGSVSRLAGGLFHSVRSLVLNLAGLDVRPTVLSLRDAHTEEDLSAWLPLRPHTVCTWGHRGFGYAPGLGKVLDERAPELLHCHGIWQYPNVAAHRWAGRHNRPLLISPHGMLDPWAVGLHRWKKRLAGLLYQDRILRRARCLSALCEAEYQAIRQYGLRGPVCILPNGVDVPEKLDRSAPPPWAGRVPEGQRVLFFLGRLHPKKGLPALVRALSLLQQRKAPGAADWTLVVAGWDQGGHEAEVKSEARGLGLNGKVRFVGALYGAAKAAAYAHAGAFVLPSFSEGLPMAVLEAFSYAVPVVMTPECNLPEGFAAGAAVRVTTRPEDLAGGLADLFAMSEAERREMGQRGRRLAQDRYRWPAIAAQLQDVYRWALGAGTPPACVRLD